MAVTTLRRNGIMTKQAKKTVYMDKTPNGYVIKANPNDKEAIEELRSWLLQHIALPKGKYYDNVSKSIVIPDFVFSKVVKKFNKDFVVLPLATYFEHWSV